MDRLEKKPHSGLDRNIPSRHTRLAPEAKYHGNSGPAGKPCG